ARTARGVQLSAGVNRAGALYGAQITGGVNLVRGVATGAQIGLVNVAGDLDGGQTSLVNVTDDVRGFQTSLVNVAADVQGGQVALVNVAKDVQGGQTALFSLAGDVDGGQVSLSNLAGDVRGAQIGLVNAGGHVRGVQIGLVNVADRVDGLSIAPVNVIGNVRTQAVFWTAGARLPVNVAVKYRQGLFYTLWGVGYDDRDGEALLAPGAGLGVHLDFEPLFFEADAFWQHEQNITGDTSPGTHALRYRAALGWEPVRGFALFAGGGPQHDFPRDGDQTWRPHAFAGVQIF
ncbi:MAG TPA: hypothetical protein VK081_04380, partial [Planctomycetota bacterium]|nr:hypothetical protein [Planctomycetota bacterium]